MKTEEVDAVLQREDLRLAVQPKAERLDVRLDLLEYLPEQQLVAVDDVKVVHVPAIYEAAVIPRWSLSERATVRSMASVR